MTLVPELWALRGSPNDPPLRKSERSIGELLLGRMVGFQGVVFGAHFPDGPHPGTGQLRRPSG